MKPTLEDLLQLAVQKEASDLHLKAGIIPVVRRHGSLRPLSSQLEALSAEELESMALQIMDTKQKSIFEEFHEVDLSYGISGLGRFRISVFKQRGTIRLVARSISHTLPTFEDLNLPKAIQKLTLIERGLILITGATGSGKSSTLAAFLDEINRTQNTHILTIEDPIEYLIRDRKSIITQREIGTDSTSYSRALRSALRQDPDVIMIGEMRDRETIEIALTAAETGHLVLSTLHTLDAVETINRVVGAFETHQQGQVRHQLGAVLKAVVSQRLAKRHDKSGFVPAVEILINNPRVREVIENKESAASLYNLIEDGNIGWGMQTFDQSLMELVVNGKISFEEALANSTSPEDFRIRYSGVSQQGNKWANSIENQNRINQKMSELDEVEIEVPTRVGKKRVSSGEDQD